MTSSDTHIYGLRWKVISEEQELAGHSLFILVRRGLGRAAMMEMLRR